MSKNASVSKHCGEGGVGKLVYETKKPKSTIKTKKIYETKQKEKSSYNEEILITLAPIQESSD